jgi:oligoribonuclease NrnB/cAMP/cGMP phosphodiesterase (DHH superfamily)
MTEYLVIFHGNCFDGFTAAWIASRFTKEWHGAEFMPARYGDLPPDVTGKDVLIVDFSWPRETLRAMKAQAHSLWVLDHHKTAEADCKEFPFCTFDMERSGAGLAWDELVGGARPWLVNIIEDRDLWRISYPDTKPIMAYVACQAQNFNSWDRIADLTRSECEERGKFIQQYIDEYGRKARAEHRAELVGGYLVPTVNLPYMNCSDHVTALAEECPDAPFAAGYFRRGDGRWQFSLRANGDFDVSEVAKKFGGGGHKGAAGFDVEHLPW